MSRLAALLFVLIALAMMPAVAAAGEFSGKVVAVSEGQFVMSANGEQLMFVVNADTAITLDGKEATLLDLLAGPDVNVSAEEIDGKLTAVSINARSS